MTDVLTFGESMGSLRGTGPLRLGGTMRLTIAGAESNVAIGLSRLGHRVRWVGMVGADEIGALVLRTLRAEDVDTAYCHTHAQASTGLMLLEQRAALPARVRYYRSGSAGSRLSAEMLDAALAAGARHLHVTGITPALSASAAAATAHAVRRAREQGWQASLDVNHRTQLWSREQAARALRPLLPSIDVLFASGDELEIVADAATDPAAALLDAGIAEIVVTRGGAGAELTTAAGTISTSSFQTVAVDTVGAGDAFVAGYLSARLDGLDVAERLRRAIVVAGVAVATAGDWEGLPTRDDLDQLSGEELTLR